jgi:hypothetical protein
MGTQLVAVRAALIDALGGLPEFSSPGPTGQTPQLSFGLRSSWESRERVWTQRARFEHEPASMRSTKTYREEVGEFDLMIYVHCVGTSQQVTSERVVELMVAAEDWVATHANWQAPDPLVPGLNVLLVTGNGVLAEELDEQGGGRAQINVPIRYKARLT